MTVGRVGSQSIPGEKLKLYYSLYRPDLTSAVGHSMGIELAFSDFTDDHARILLLLGIAGSI